MHLRLASIAVLLFISAASSRGWNGKISGKVVSANDGKTIAGAEVVIQFSGLKVSSDTNGWYVIQNVAPGTYSILALANGFEPLLLKDVRVAMDQSLFLDCELKATKVIDMEEIVVSADRNVVDQSRTSVRASVGADEFSRLPIRTATEITAGSPSLYKGFLRGGKVYETKTTIDGVDVTDQFYSAAVDQGSFSVSPIVPLLIYNGITRQRQAQKSSAFDLNLSALQEGTVITGGYGAEHANSSAGQIAYELKEGKGDVSGRANVRVSQIHLSHRGPQAYHDDSLYFKERASLFVTDSIRSKRYTYYPGKYSYGDSPTLDAELAVGGNFTKDAGAYGTFGYFNSTGRLPNEFTRRVSSSLKSHFLLSSTSKLVTSWILEDRGRVFGWKNRNYSDDFRFFLEGVPQWDGVNVMGSAKFIHTINPKTVFEVQASFVRDVTRQGFSDDNNNGIVELGENGDFLTFADTAQVNRYMSRLGGSDFSKFFSPTPKDEAGSKTVFATGEGATWKIARPGIYYEKFKSAAYTIRGDISSQVTEHHQLKGGLQGRFQEYDRTMRAAYIGGVYPSYKNYVEEIWTVQPKEFSGYVQHRMELAGLFINTGFRLEGLDIDAADYSNYFAPFTEDTIRNETGSMVGLRRVPVRGEKAGMKWFFSPRLGVSHPIGEDAAMYFSFSRQKQSAPFSRLYVSYNDFGNPSFPVVTRPDQDPIISTSYDLGVQWTLASGFGFDINAYYKDIQNYGVTQVQVVPKSPWRSYFVSTNFGYADSRGVELTLRANNFPVSDFLTAGGRISYTYSYIKEAVYAGGNVTNFSTAGGDSALYSGQIPFVNIGAFNTIEQNVRGGNSTLTGGYDRTHRITYRLLLQLPAEILVSSIGTFMSGFFYPITLQNPRGRELGVGPWSKNIDFRFEKGFTALGLGRIGIYVDVVNAFNWTNVQAYHTGPIGQMEWEKNSNPAGGPKINRPITQDGSMIYDVPREVYFGLNISF